MVTLFLMDERQVAEEGQIWWGYTNETPLGRVCWNVIKYNGPIFEEKGTGSKTGIEKV